MTSIRFRFVGLSFAGVAIALALSAWFFVTLFSANLSARTDRELTSHLNRLAAMLAFDNNGNLLRPDGPADNRFHVAYGGLYWQIEDTARHAELRSPSLFDYALPLPSDTGSSGVVQHYRIPGPSGNPVIVQERDLIVSAPDGPRRLRLAVAIDAATVDSATSEFAAAILPYMAALAALLAVFSGLQISWGLRPLSRLTASVKEIQERRINRLEGGYPDELMPLVDETNLLLESQDKAMERARARASDLAHGLKTPLTVIANNALTLRERGDTEMADELDCLAQSMLAHVNHELTRSRLVPNAQQRRSDAGLNKTVGEVVRTLSRIPEGARLQWSVEVGRDIEVLVDPHDLRELLGNILENAVKWAHSSVSVETIAAPEHWVLIVEDDGPGVPPENIKSLTHRGLRLDHEKPGTGLGLAIVKEITDTYHIDLSFENRSEGGLRVTLAFPMKI